MSRPLILISFFFLCAFPIWADTANPETFEGKRKLGIGFAYTGGLIRYGFKKHWSLEGHYLIGKASSNDGDVHSTAMGLRAYRHFRLDKRLQWYAGADASYLSAKSDHFKSSFGLGAGGFGGMEYYILPRLSIGFDLGPYYIKITQNQYGGSESGLEFILNSFLNFYIF